MLLIALALAGCGGDTPAEEAAAPEPAPMEDAMPDSRYNQSPMLNQRVLDGTLPPVDERLPLNPVVITPRADLGESVGQYGGTLAVMAIDPNYDAFGAEWGDGGGYVNESLATFDLADRVFTENIAESWSVNDELTELTVNLREGVRWSDGNALTTDDIAFWWDDIMLNETLTPSIPAYFKSADGEPMTVNVIDDYTFSLQYSSRYAAIADRLSSLQPWAPKAYLTTWHPDYSDNAAAVATDEGFAEWYEAFLAHYAGRAFIIYGPDRPILGPYIVGPLDSVGTRLSERNPFYWKVDPEGNQLPYIDYMDIEVVENEETRLLNLSEGKYDASFRDGSSNPTHIPFLTQKAEDGDYTLYTDWVNGAGGWPCWLINQDYIGDGEDPDKDAEIRALLRDVNWRKGVSVAIDRERLIDVVWDGIGIPQQSTISPQAWHFQSPEGQAINEAWQQADAEYDPDLAAQRFEAAGFTDQDGDGWRDLPSGKSFQLILDSGDWGGQVISENSNIELKEQMTAIGIDAIVNDLFGQPEWGSRQTEAKYMFRNCHASELDIWTYPDWIFPLRGNRAWPLQGRWRQTGGAEGEEPLPGSPAAKLQALYDKGIATGDQEERHKVVWEAVQIHIDEGPFTLGGAGDQPMPVVIKNYFKNVPSFGILGPWAPGSPGNVHPEQFYIEQ
jgi:peptide/nickel transport system substrate-binding protein